MSHIAKIYKNKVICVNENAFSKSHHGTKSNTSYTRNHANVLSGPRLTENKHSPNKTMSRIASGNSANNRHSKTNS